MLALLLFVCAGSCTAGPAGTVLGESARTKLALARGESQPLGGTDPTLFFEAVVEDLPTTSDDHLATLLIQRK